MTESELKACKDIPALIAEVRRLQEELRFQEELMVHVAMKHKKRDLALAVAREVLSGLDKAYWFSEVKEALKPVPNALAQISEILEGGGG